MNPILFPNVKKFSDLFDIDKQPPIYDSRGSRYWRVLHLSNGYASLSSYCMIPAKGKFKHRSIPVIPKLSVIEKLKSCLVVPGELYFTIVRQDNDPTTGLVIVRYQQLLADVWLAYIDASKLPNDNYPALISKQERKTPTFKWLNLTPKNMRLVEANCDI
jgi:hypothetical protein